MKKISDTNQYKIIINIQNYNIIYIIDSRFEALFKSSNMYISILHLPFFLLAVSL